MRTWHTKRNCSFTPRQVGYFYLSMFLFSSFIATYFLLHGVWMILIFTVIELTVLGIALLVYARHALDYESIAIDGTALKIEKNIGGKIQRHVFNTRWLTLTQEKSGKRLIRVEERSKEMPIGIFVPLDARPQFYRDLRAQIRMEA
ncbi:DUF2244 domain-containing protein [Polynucleobacter acidiphobus]|uniref:DUF2244 domain-containing protein n=1 Tax=Polynucleobacter acidiphobus TaxID=556053 RepID=UPI000D37AF49|nr:DUF2244 domain-containing protein [Polynucleobacter acidiphobus]